MSHVDRLGYRQNARNGTHSNVEAFSCPYKPRGEQERVILVGLGLASLTAARDLLGKANMLGIEAQNRPFGRILTLNMAGVALDLGANWQHTPERGTFRNEPAVYTAKISHDNFLHEIFINGKPARGQAFYEAHYAADNRINNNTVSGLSLEDLLTWEQVSYYGAFFRNQFCESDAGVEPEQVSADACRFEHQTNDGDVFYSGFEAVLQNMFSDTMAQVPMLFNSPVVEIINRSDYAAVVTANGKKYYADKILLSPSIGVLKSGLIKFTPELPQKFKDALSGLRMGVLEKFVCHMAPGFFINNSIQENAQVHILDANHKPLFAVLKPAGKPFVVFLTGGNHSRKLLKMSEHEMVGYFIHALRQCYDNVDILDFAHTWHQHNPYIMGSYSAAKVDHWDARRHLQDPWLRLKIIGEGLHHPFAGQVPAAHLSGKLAADWVLGRNGLYTNGHSR